MHGRPIVLETLFVTVPVNRIISALLTTILLVLKSVCIVGYYLIVCFCDPTHLASLHVVHVFSSAPPSLPHCQHLPSSSCLRGATPTWWTNMETCNFPTLKVFLMNSLISFSYIKAPYACSSCIRTILSWFSSVLQPTLSKEVEPVRVPVIVTSVPKLPVFLTATAKGWP